MTEYLVSEGVLDDLVESPAKFRRAEIVDDIKKNGCIAKSINPKPKPKPKPIIAVTSKPVKKKERKKVATVNEGLIKRAINKVKKKLKR